METLAISKQERRRWELFSRVREGELTLVKASELLGLSYRQAKRSYGRYRSEGDGGVVHGLPERPVRVAAMQPPGKPQRVSGAHRKPSAKHPWRKPDNPSAGSMASVARGTKE